MTFLCNICGQNNTVETLEQEASSCAGCGSNVRLRALIYLLSKELFGDGFPLTAFPRLRGVKGLGLSDQLSYAGRLAEKFDYTNTFYDREPHLDITEAHPECYGSYDFILSSDVFEHIAPPVQRAFDESCKLLKPCGVLCLSVPFSLGEETVERFPNLHDYTLVNLGGSPVLINRSKEGELEIRGDLVFHGGVGATLEMRLFSQKDLAAKLFQAGFRDVAFLTEPVPGFGIVFEGAWSLPLVARRGDFVYDRGVMGQFAREYHARMKELAELGLYLRDATAQVEQRAQQADRLDAELAERGAWGIRLEEDLAEARRNLEHVQALFEERTRWAKDLQAEAEIEARRASELRAKLEAVAESRWIKLGNRLGLGPKLSS